MKMLAWHCAEVAYQDVERATRPPAIPRDLVPLPSVVRSFRNVLLAMLTIEEGDTSLQAGYTAVAIVDLARQAGLREVLLLPFAHLSDRLASPHLARTLLASCRERVETSGLLVELASFGYHKDIEFRFRSVGHPGSVAYRHFEASGRVPG